MYDAAIVFVYESHILLFFYFLEVFIDFRQIKQREV